MKKFKLLRGYHQPTLLEVFEELTQNYQPINIPTLPQMPQMPTIQPIWTAPTWYTPTWVVNPGLIQYTQPNYTITTTPGYGTYTIPYAGTINTASNISLTTSNSSETTTYTTCGYGGILTTGTAFFSNTANTAKF